MMKIYQTHPNADWPWWKITGAGLLGFGTFALIIIFMPPRMFCSEVIGITSIIFAIPIAIWNWKVYSKASRKTLTALLSIQILIIGFRSWNQVYSHFWLYPMTGAYILAWFLPAIDPALSKLLWREQTAPKTKLGRLILGLSLSLVPVAGVLGSSIGMFRSRFEGITGMYLIAGPLSFVTAIAIAISSYQIWSDHPSAKQIEGSRNG